MESQIIYRFQAIFLLILISCSTADLTEQVFPINQEGIIIDFSKIKTIDQFDSLYCELQKSRGELPLIIPFNFSTSTFDQTSSVGITAIGNEMHCSGLDCCDQGVSLLVMDEKIYLYDEYVNLDQIDSLVRLNFYNYGNDPFLSYYPEDALFILKAYPKVELTSFQTVLNSISKSYLNIITEQAKKVGLKQSIDSFPLNLIITTYKEPPPLPDWVKDLEIEIADDLAVDSLCIEGLD